MLQSPSSKIQSPTGCRDSETVRSALRKVHCLKSSATEVALLKSEATTARITGYWQVDQRTRLTLDVHNLFNKTYYTASWGALTVIPGPGRQVVAGVQVAF